jgi:hypothetical protein
MQVLGQLANSYLARLQVPCHLNFKLYFKPVADSSRDWLKVESNFCQYLKPT